MPGRLYLTHNAEEISQTIGVAAPPELIRGRNISPGEEVSVFTLNGWSNMRWGIIPVGRKNARGRPVMETIINARSETVFDKSAFLGTTRAVVPASGWYEWVGEKRRKKTVWDLSLKSGSILCIAAICDQWAGPGGITVDQVATLTCPPNEDVAPIHHRMGVFLDPHDINDWLTTDTPERFLRSLDNGLLTIEETTDPSRFSDR